MKRLIKLFIWICLLGVAGYYFMRSEKTISSDSIPSITPTIVAEAVPEEKAKISSGLASVVDLALNGSAGTYSVVIKNLKTEEMYQKDEDKEYEAASLYKLWIMATVFDQIKKGTLKEEDILSSSIKDLNAKYKIDEENAELTEGSISLSVKNALTQMITISHNYAALLLGAKVRLTTVEAFLKSHELLASHTGQPPKTTASDIALYMEKLYNGELGSMAHTKQMLDLLKAQKLNNKLPLKLPVNTVMAHKTGELGLFTHDAGIVFTPKGDYIIVILSESSSPKGAEGRIATVSKAVYDYFSHE